VTSLKAKRTITWLAASTVMSYGRFAHPKSCHHRRSELQREETPPTDNPRNVFEVIGRWLLSVAEYFELMCDTFRLFGEFLIDLARRGYGAELGFP